MAMQQQQGLQQPRPGRGLKGFLPDGTTPPLPARAEGGYSRPTKK